MANTKAEDIQFMELQLDQLECVVGGLAIDLLQLNGNQDQITGLNDNDTVGTLKVKIHSQLGIPPEQQRLIFNGQQLNDGQTLSHYNIGEGSDIYAVQRLRGG